MTERSVAVYRMLGAIGAGTHYRHRFAILPDYEYLGELPEEHARMAGLEEIPDPDWPAGEIGRWICPDCGGRHVQISLPHWYRETLSTKSANTIGSLNSVSVDEGAKPLWWYCEDCDHQGIGEPTDGYYCSTSDDGPRGAWVDGDIEGSRIVED